MSLHQASAGRAKLFLTYHEFGDEKKSYSYYCLTARFEEHLRLAAALRQSSSSRFYSPEFTFDDGHISQHSHAQPLLEQYGMRAIFFVTAGWTNTRKDYMRWSELRELHNHGHQVQSHTW